LLPYPRQIQEDIAGLFHREGKARAQVADRPDQTDWLIARYRTLGQLVSPYVNDLLTLFDPKPELTGADVSEDGSVHVYVKHPDYWVRRAADRNRFRYRARLEKGKCLRSGLKKRQFLALRFCRSRRNGSALKHLAGTLHADGIGCTLPAGREVKMEIPV